MDKRKHDRITLSDKNWRAELMDLVSARVLGEVANLSPGGMMLITSSEIRIESLYQVECHATAPDGCSTCFSAGVMVLWRTEASQRGAHWVGLQIIDIDEASRTELLALATAMAADG